MRIAVPAPEPVEFSVEDAMLNGWAEESGDYLRLDHVEYVPREAPTTDQS